MRLIRISFSLLFNIPLQILAIIILYKYNLKIHEDLETLRFILNLMAFTTIFHILAFVFRILHFARCIKESFASDAIQIIYCIVTVINILCAIDVIFFNRRLPRDISPDLIPSYRRITSALRKVCQFLEIYSTIFIISITISYLYKSTKKRSA